MIDQILGIVLMGLGMKNPVMPPNNVLGDETEAFVATDSEELKQMRQEQLEERKKLLESQKEELRQKKEDYLESRRKTREEYKEQLKQQREATIEAAKERKEAFKTRLETIKDEKKKELVERLGEKFTEINSKRLEALNNHLAKLEDILNRLQTKIDELEAMGIDVTTANTAVSEAQAAITAAKTALEEQAGKEYVIGITLESKLGEDVSRTRLSMQEDFTDVKDAMQKAKAAVRNAVQVTQRLKEANAAE